MPGGDGGGSHWASVVGSAWRCTPCPAVIALAVARLPAARWSARIACLPDRSLPSRRPRSSGPTRAGGEACSWSSRASPTSRPYTRAARPHAGRKGRLRGPKGRDRCSLQLGFASDGGDARGGRPASCARGPGGVAARDDRGGARRRDHRPGRVGPARVRERPRRADARVRGRCRAARGHSGGDPVAVRAARRLRPADRARGAARPARAARGRHRPAARPLSRARRARARLARARDPDPRRRRRPDRVRQRVPRRHRAPPGERGHAPARRDRGAARRLARLGGDAPGCRAARRPVLRGLVHRGRDRGRARDPPRRDRRREPSRPGAPRRAPRALLADLGVAAAGLTRPARRGDRDHRAVRPRAARGDRARRAPPRADERARPAVGDRAPARRARPDARRGHVRVEPLRPALRGGRHPARRGARPPRGARDRQRAPLPRRAGCTRAADLPRRGQLRAGRLARLRAHPRPRGEARSAAARRLVRDRRAGERRRRQARRRRVRRSRQERRRRAAAPELPGAARAARGNVEGAALRRVRADPAGDPRLGRGDGARPGSAPDPDARSAWSRTSSSR